MTPHPYQAECLAAIKSGWATYRTQAIEVPTGGGKTTLFSWVIEDHLPVKSLVLVDRDELADQAIEEIREVTGLWPAKEKAQWKASRMSQVVVASIQTMQGRRLQSWRSDHFGLVVADECHKAVSPSYAAAINHFSSAHVLGVTATPKRSDERNIGEIFQNMAYRVSYDELVKDGFLSPLVPESLQLQIDVGGVERTMGDFNPDQLGAALDKYLPQIAKLLFEKTQGQGSGLVFLPLVATSKRMNQCMLDAGFKSEHVDGESHDRKEVVARFKAGKTNAVCNAMLLSYGFNARRVDWICVLRLTQSEGLYRQMLGRGTRTSPETGKTRCIVYDPLWLHPKFSMCSSFDLVAGDKEEADGMRQIAMEREKFGEPELSLGDLLSEYSARKEKKLAEELEKQARKDREKEELERRRIENAKRAFDAATFRLDERGLGGTLATPPQLKLLIKLGTPNPHTKTRLEASKIISALYYK